MKYHFAKNYPIENGPKLWELQLFLMKICERYLGKKDVSKIIYQPVFNDSPPCIINTPNSDGAFASLSRNAATYWPTALFELAHETVHLLNPAVRSNYLEEGFASLFSLQMSIEYGDSSGNFNKSEYQITLDLLYKIPEKDLWQVGRTIRENFGAFSSVTVEELLELFPHWGLLLCMKLLTPFNNSIKNEFVRLEILPTPYIDISGREINRPDNEISLQLLFNDEVASDVYGIVNDVGYLVSVIKIYKEELRNKGIGFKIFKYLFLTLGGYPKIKVICGSWHAGGEFQDYEDGRSTNLKSFKDSIENGNDEVISAFSTPTGKWARKLGFNKCNIISNSIESVEVEFYKEDL